MIRRLPVYLLIDTSGSMRGEPITAVKNGIESLLEVLRTDPYALDTVAISIITYDKDVKQILPMTSIENVQLPDIVTPESGPTHTGAALNMLCDKMRTELRQSTSTTKGDWMPILFIMTDGKPSDSQVYAEAAERVKRSGFGQVIGLAAGPKADPESLKLVTNNVLKLDNMDSQSVMSCFKWVSSVIGQGSRSAGLPQQQQVQQSVPVVMPSAPTVQRTQPQPVQATANDFGMLPPPPPEVNIIL